MRCRFGDKKIRQFRKRFGLDIIYADTRGNTDHAICLYTRDGNEYILTKDGELHKCTNPAKVRISQDLLDHWPVMTPNDIHQYLWEKHWENVAEAMRKYPPFGLKNENLTD